jgi:hypothetical protein
MFKKVVAALRACGEITRNAGDPSDNAREKFFATLTIALWITCWLLWMTSAAFPLAATEPDSGAYPSNRSVSTRGEQFAIAMAPPNSLPTYQSTSPPSVRKFAQATIVA